METHKPQRVKGLYVREAPAVEAARRRPKSRAHARRWREDALIGRSLAEREQLVVRRGVGNVAIVGVRKRFADGICTSSP